MAEEKIIAGDIVQLKSGGPEMVVRFVGDYDKIHCIWFNHYPASKYCYEDLDLLTLKKVNIIT